MKVTDKRAQARKKSMDKSKLRRKREEEAAIEAIGSHRRLSAVTLLNDVMQLAPSAIQFKKEIMHRKEVPDFLKLQNANDILDRTLPKPTQQVNINAAVLQANYTDRELKDILANRLLKMGLVQGSEQ